MSFLESYAKACMNFGILLIEISYSNFHFAKKSQKICEKNKHAKHIYMIFYDSSEFF
jgi:hypothetical protein